MQESPSEESFRASWKLRPRTIAKTSMPDAFALVNSQVIHGLFGDPNRKTMYHFYTVETQEVVGQQATLSVAGAFYNSLEDMVVGISRLKPSPGKIWLYLPERKYILYIEGVKFLCMDYSRFKDGDTPIVEVDGLINPTGNVKELEVVITVVYEFFLQAYETVKPPVVNDPNCCSFCQKASSEAMKMTCSRCRMTYYCDRSCQGKHWPAHQKVCTPIKVTAPSPQFEIERDRGY